MAKIIDVRASGGQLVVLGNSIALPASSTSTFAVNQPMVSGSIRYNPATNSIEYLGNQSTDWLTITGAVPISGHITPSAITTSGSIVSHGQISADGAITGSNLSGTNTGDQTITLTGAVTGSGTGSFGTTLTNSSVTNAKMANMASGTLKGRLSAGTGSAEDLTLSQVTAQLPTFNANTRGLLDAGGANGYSVLRADGSWGFPDVTMISSVANLGPVSYTNSGSNFVQVTSPTAATLALTSTMASQRRHIQTTASAGGMVEQYSQQMCHRSSKGGGFHVVWRFGIGAIANDAKFFCGLIPSAFAMTNVNPSTLFDFVGLVKNSGDNRFTMQANGSSGTAQSVDITTVETLSTAPDSFWQFEMFAAPNVSDIRYKITRWDTATTNNPLVASGVMTGVQGAAGGMPALTAIFAPHLWMCATTATPVTLCFSSFVCVPYSI